MSEGITFKVETSRVLQILSNEIYDSPHAMLRENVQNAYDAIRMRFVKEGVLQEGGKIDINIAADVVSVTDNGIGMSEQVLRENFWRAGSSGKNTKNAKQAGVIGTFGIGAMANFGVCSELVVETRSMESGEVLRSTAKRDSLRFEQECIVLERPAVERDYGTTIKATLDAQSPITPAQAKQYLVPYVGYLPVPVYLNGEHISGRPISDIVRASGALTFLSRSTEKDELCTVETEISMDVNGQVLVKMTDIQIGGTDTKGEAILFQNAGQLMGLRSYFGLAPIPVTGYYAFGGIANLAFLHPTAGREALSRESIAVISRLIVLAEKAASEAISSSSGADKNNAFLRWIAALGRYDLASNISVRMYPENTDIPLRDVEKLKSQQKVHYYQGTDAKMINAFSGDGLALLQVAQSNPRKSVQVQYLHQLKVGQVPDSIQILKEYSPSELSLAEAAIVLRIGAVLRDDYLIPQADVAMAEISHGVNVVAVKRENSLRVCIARSGPSIAPLLQVHEKSYELLTQFVKDFVRVTVYNKIEQYVPSSTKGGVDALRKVLQRNRELFRYEESDLGDFASVLGDFMSGEALEKVLATIRTTARSHGQKVSADQVGSLENVVPDVVSSPVQPEGSEDDGYQPSPPIVRTDIVSKMKILVADQRHPQLNNFLMLLGLSDRLVQVEGDFFHVPHTTRILWGGHRVIYIFTEATGRLSLYYDIELKSPLAAANAGGGMFATTTLITKDRIFVPVPDALLEDFRVSGGPREFFVRFDLIVGSAP